MIKQRLDPMDRLRKVQEILVGDAVRWHKEGEQPDACARLHESVLNYIQALRAAEKQILGEASE